MVPQTRALLPREEAQVWVVLGVRRGNEPTNRTEGQLRHHPSGIFFFFFCQLDSWQPERASSESNLPNMVGNVKTRPILAFIFEANKSQGRGAQWSLQRVGDNTGREMQIMHQFARALGFPAALLFY